MALLEITGLSRSFGGLKAVADVSFTVEKGTITSVIGPNGAGKTTLFNLICGNLTADSGTILFHGQPIHGWPAHRIAGQGLSRTFQNIKMFPGMTALENVMVGCHTVSQAGFLAGMLSLPGAVREEKRIREQAMALLEQMGIAQYAHCDAASLAFGQQRAVELARALAARPELLLLDEPAAGLNMYETAELAQRIKGLSELDSTILLVEHDMSLVMDISDAIVVLNFGRKIAEGTPAAVQRNPEVVKIYLGDEHAAG